MKNPDLSILIRAATVSCLAGERPANSDVALDDSFDRQEPGEGWHVNTGDWKIVDGVLRGSEVPAEKHSAAARRIVETKNAVYEL